MVKNGGNMLLNILEKVPCDKYAFYLQFFCLIVANGGDKLSVCLFVR